MSADPNKKSPRTFQCRDTLWEAFEQLAGQLECSVDYLVNEAMKQYARHRSDAGRLPLPIPANRENREPAGGPNAGSVASAPHPPTPRTRPLFGRTTNVGLPPPPASPASSGRLPVPSLPAHHAHSSVGNPSSPRAQAAAGRAPAASSSPTATPSADRSDSESRRAQGTASTQLSIVYRGDKLAVNKDRFVIGRGKQSSDFTLRDPNVSRQHAMVEYQSGAYFIVDMGSTNGVEHNGQRIARKQIVEGDVFRICDHELLFTYR
ncbi:MAG: FHA domain-containing protein [Polyangiaceae bacterium]|nr:FHA domain-containing protein [Polyangiaceae bacterium]